MKLGGEFPEGGFPDTKILLIDDDPNSRDILSRLLGEMGLRNIDQFKTALEAMAFIESQKHWSGIVLCDWNMPHMSGASFYRKLKEKRPNLPFVMISGRNDEDSILFAKDHGIESYLLKPVVFEDLERKLHVAAMSAALKPT